MPDRLAKTEFWFFFSRLVGSPGPMCTEQFRSADMSVAAFLIFSGLLEELCGLVSYSTIGGHLILNPGHQGRAQFVERTTCIYMLISNIVPYFSFHGIVLFCPLFFFDKLCNVFCVR